MSYDATIKKCADPNLDRIIRTWSEIEHNPENFAQFVVTQKDWDPRYPEGLTPLSQDVWPTWNIDATTLAETQIFSRFSFIGERAIQHLTLPAQSLFDDFNAFDAMEVVQSRAWSLTDPSNGEMPTEIGIRLRNSALESTGGFLGAVIITGKPEKSQIATEVIYPKLFHKVVALYLKEFAVRDYRVIEERMGVELDEENMAELIGAEYATLISKLLSTDPDTISEFTHTLVLGTLFKPSPY